MFLTFSLCTLVWYNRAFDGNEAVENLFLSLLFSSIFICWHLTLFSVPSRHKHTNSNQTRNQELQSLIHKFTPFFTPTTSDKFSSWCILCTSLSFINKGLRISRFSRSGKISAVNPKGCHACSDLKNKLEIISKTKRSQQNDRLDAQNWQSIFDVSVNEWKQWTSTQIRLFHIEPKTNGVDGTLQHEKLWAKSVFSRIVHKTQKKHEEEDVGDGRNAIWSWYGKFSFWIIET